ncbi:hypothetical protein RGUI_2946 [Rhodovulum sp. P5]|uniref:PEP-CTERM sorting domain-containing protein n=1 Tax=Rhodovulum sp. P5 TaxID=1564506 RepID=UPI0009C31867|nr:PEP-CTERM sorting domain-containing protein [Rhodovulum sp. P5]ARE41087.1 hypothetical protein RGUI_2946 [Rhodovulum sp. P5]
MQSIVRTGLAGAGLALLASSAFALTISENDVGDFENTNDPYSVTDTVGVLDLGLNTVSGSIQSDCKNDGQDILCIGGADASDVFIFTIAAGQQLDSLVATISGFGPTGFAPGSGIFEANTIFENDTAVLNGTKALYASFMPLGANSYVFGIGQGLASAEGAAEYDWTLEYTVSAAPVPVPGAMGLLLAGLAGLGLRRKTSRP